MAGNAVDVAALLNKATAGDEAALRQLLFIHHARLAGTIQPMIGERLQATLSVDDVLQETFVAAFSDIKRFRGGDQQSFFSWLRTIAMNRIRDAGREANTKKRGGDFQKISNQMGQGSAAFDLLMEISDAGNSPSGIVANDEALDALQIAIASLPEDQRDAIRLHCLDGFTLEETAQRMGRTWDSIRGLIQRGKKALQVHMQQSSLWFSGG